MLVTEKFVYLHQPKTGGTFVTAVLLKIHEDRGDEVETIWLEPGEPARVPPVPRGRVVKLMSRTRNQHGARQDIPPDYRDRPILATIRNPYDRYVSQYEFAWWRTFPEMFGPVDVVRKAYPHYPELTFDDFVRLTNAVSVPYRDERAPDEAPGFHTQQFVEYFFRDPRVACSLLTTDAGRDLAVSDMRDLRFLDQDHLNLELHDFLLQMGYPPGDVEFVRSADRILPPEGGRARDVHWSAYYSPELKAFVRRKEDWLLRLFPQFDV